MIDLNSPIFAQELRRVVNDAIGQRLRETQPRAQYGVVDTVDATNFVCSVYLSGDTSSTPGYTWAPHQAPASGDRVRVVRTPLGDAYVDEVYGRGAMPTGAIVAFGGTSAPLGFLLCQGQSLLRTDYADLFAAIGTTYGSVDGTHFTLPDLQQRFPLGKASSGTGSTLGSAGGAIDHTHTQPTHVHTTPNHAHRLPFYIGSSSILHWSATPGAYGADSNAQDLVRNQTGTTESLSNNSASLSQSTNGGNTGSGGNDATGSQNAPYQVVNYIIKT